MLRSELASLPFYHNCFKRAEDVINLRLLKIFVLVVILLKHI